MKELYVTPICELIMLSEDDIVTSSFNGSEIRVRENNSDSWADAGEIDW